MISWPSKTTLQRLLDLAGLHYMTSERSGPFWQSVLHNILSRPLSFLGWTTAMIFWLDLQQAQTVAADRWLLVWSSLDGSDPCCQVQGKFAGLLAPAGWIDSDLHCTVLHLSLTWFLLEETLNVLLLCLTLFSFHFFNTKLCKKQNKLLLHQYYTYSIFNKHIIIWLKTKQFNVKMFLDIANENKTI